MSLVKGRFGIEYSPRPKRKDSPHTGKIILAISILAAVSFAVTCVKRYISSREEARQTALEEEAFLASRERSSTSNPSASTPATSPNVADEKTSPITNSNANWATAHERDNRQVRVRNLLMRLDEAEKQANIVMAVSTIEEIRALPGEPAADIDDRLARRLGVLNVKWLFERGNRQWVADVKVNKGDNATRIAKNHGSTLESLVKLNKLSNPDNLKVGSTIKVLNHPRFNLAIHKRAKYADLHLNGKFFNRYDFSASLKSASGVYKAEQNVRAQLDRIGLDFNHSSREELGALLVPGNSTISISDL